MKKYAIVDIETTGGRATRDKITEVAVVLFDGQQVVDTFESLVNPECYIPYGITELTGITQEMVNNAPKFYEIARKVIEITEGAIFVAHNVRFDYGFIREEFRRLGYSFSRKQLCTVRLSRKVFPGFRSYSLGKLIYDLEIDEAIYGGIRHRAMADAKATTEILKLILNQNQGTDQVKELVNLGVRESLLPQNWNVEKIHQLPDDCGVYYFHDAAGEIVYIGKSIDIRKRVASHFTKKTEKARKLQEKSYDLSFELTGSELVALILESDEIKKHNPPVNRAQRARFFPYIIHSFYNDAGYLCFDVAKVTAKTKKEYQIVSEYPKGNHAKGALKRQLEAAGLCAKLCGLEKSGSACFNYHIGKCAGACAEIEPPEAYNERALLVKETLQTAFEEDFVIVDKGRNDEEKSLIFIQDGGCIGYTYAGIEELNATPEQWKDGLRRINPTPELSKIILRHLADHPNLKRIRVGTRRLVNPSTPLTP